jgi:aspartate ammonia-lyase
MSKSRDEKVESIEKADKADKAERVEKDLLGSAVISNHVYYGIQSQRAIDNFQLSNVPIHHYPNFIKALAMVKQACAIANYKLGLLEENKFLAINLACLDVMQGKLDQHFQIDMLQGGAGTSANMNANEVIANRALEIMGQAKGQYQFLHPNDDVNKSQSTNDVYPSAIKLATLLNSVPVVSELSALSDSFMAKAGAFSNIVKMGRTQLQDAVPMTLGQEFEAFAKTLRKDRSYILNILTLLYELNLGGTAIGTGVNADPKFGLLAVNNLKQISGYPFRQATNLIEATADTGCFVALSSALKGTAVKLSKICNDLRLLSSGPRAGLHEINLPPVQPGSSIMPGKVNPVIPEAVNQVAYSIMGNDLAITMAAEAGQLQLNAMEPLILFKLMQTTELMSRAMSMLRRKCVDGITANKSTCDDYVVNSIGLITCLNPLLGYENTSKIAKMALSSGKSVTELIVEQGMMKADEISDFIRLQTAATPIQ